MTADDYLNLDADQLRELERAAYIAGDTERAALLEVLATLVPLSATIDRYEGALADLVAVINEDSDGDYFICGEARFEVDRARAVLAGEVDD